MPSSALAGVRDVLIPPRCAGCGRPGSWYCVVCRDSSEPIARRPGTLALIGTGAHEGPLREAIHRLKYGNEPGLARELGSLLGSRIAADLSFGEPLDALVPVPLHPSRRRSRGYDQARALAEVAADRDGRGPAGGAPPSARGPGAGDARSRLERRANVHGAFAGIAGSLRGLEVGLIDDVATTGATLLDAAAAARACGARTVRAYVVAIEE